MKKAMQIAFIVIFFAVCAAPLVGRLAGYENSNAEKRVLAQAPALWTEEGFNLEFTHEFDDYYSDNFAFRPDFVTTYAQLNAGLFSMSTSDQVIIGKDGWLFFTPTLNDYQRTDTFSEDEARRFAKTLALTQAWLQSRGVAFIFTIAPNKSSLYGQYMPDRYIVSDAPSNAQMLKSALEDAGVNYVDLFETFSGSDAQLYHKLDTHWNNTGALMATNALLENVHTQVPDFTYMPYDISDYTIEYSWSGDLEGMLYPTADLLDAQHIYGIDKLYRGRFQSPEDILIQTTCDTGSMDLLMMRDSFTNALILPFSNTFSSVTYSRAVPYDFSLLTEDTDVVIMEIAERNLPNLIAQAPLIPAPQIALPDDIEPAYMNIAMSTEDASDTINISGYALPPGYSPDLSYDIYIRLTIDGEAYGFMPFPIPGDDGTGYANAAFSLRIEKSALPVGEYALDVVLFDGTRWISDTAGLVTITG